MNDRRAFEAIVYVLRTGIQWNALPRELGASSTVHDRFQEWEQAGVFKTLWQAGLHVYDELEGIQWEWQAADGAMTKAPLGKAATGANPTDRGKKGTKRSLLTDGAGIPLAIVIDGADCHDVKLLCATLDGIVIARPEPTEERPQYLCLMQPTMGHQRARRSRLVTIGHIFAAVVRRSGRKSLPLAIARDAG
jgi:putative transposase